MGSRFNLRSSAARLGALLGPIGILLRWSKVIVEWMHFPKELAESLVMISASTPAVVTSLMLIIGAICAAFLVFDEWRRRRATSPHVPAPPKDGEALPAEAVKEDWIPIFKAVKCVSVILRDYDSAKCFPTTLHAIRVAAGSGELVVRGRAELPDSKNYRNADNYSAVDSEIDRRYWANSTLSAYASAPTHQAEYPTQPESALSWGPGGWGERNHYANLSVRWSDVLKGWPEAKAGR